MYIILDKKLQRIGTLSDHSLNGTPFYNDQITQQIADDDQEMTLQSVPDTTNRTDPHGNTKNWGHTLDQIFVPYGYPDTDKIAEGNSLAYKDPNNGHWYIMRLTNVTDATDSSGAHYKEASGCNLCIWKLGKTIHYIQTIRNANSTKAFQALFSDTGWYINPHTEPVGGSADISFDGTSSDQSLLQQFCQLYGAEIDAYVLFPKSVKMPDGNNYSSDFQVALKRVDIVRKLGTDNGNRIVYGRNATNIQRNIVDDNLYTRLYVYGQNGTTCACDLTNNEPYVQDNVANDKWNPGYGDNAENYLEGAITSQTMKNPERLAQWGLQQLKIFNHPRANYTVSVASRLNDENGGAAEVMQASLGDTFRVIDLKMNPVMTAEARVIRKQLSFSNPTQNNITLGEYTTVNVVPPKFISDLQQNETNHIEQIINEIQHNPGALSCTIDKPDGCTWKYGEKQKSFIAHIYVMGEDITNLISPRGFVWELFQDGEPNNDFYKAHNIDHNDGQTLTLINDIKLDDNAKAAFNKYNTPTPKTPTPNNPPVNPNSPSNNPNNIDNNNGYFNSLSGLMNNLNNNNSDNDYYDNNGYHSLGSTQNKTINNQTVGDDYEPGDNPNDNDDNGFNISSQNIEDYLNGPDLVTGTIKLLIDTDYIGEHSGINFNQNTMTHIFTTESGLDVGGDTAALQYVNYDPNFSNQCYYASSVYYGDQRPRDNNGHLIQHLSHTKIMRMDSNGNIQDSMILLFSHHNSNFGLEYKTSDQPYIWTTFQNPQTKTDYVLARLRYQPGSVINFNDLTSDEIIKHYGEAGCMANYDNSSNIVLLSHDDTAVNPSHPIDFYHASDLLNQRDNAQPFKTVRLTDYGFDPKIENYDIDDDSMDSNSDTHDPQDDSSQQTYQSCSLMYPYLFYDSGNVNMSDQRMIYCVDIQHGGLEFSKILDPDSFHLNSTYATAVIGSNPGNLVFMEPETINWTMDSNGQPCFLYGCNVAFENNRNKGTELDDEGIPQPSYKHYEYLFKVGMDLNQSKNDDNSGNNPDHSNNGHPTI